jgi:hypothetical protein
VGVKCIKGNGLEPVVYEEKMEEMERPMLRPVQGSFLGVKVPFSWRSLFSKLNNSCITLEVSFCTRDA